MNNTKMVPTTINSRWSILLPPHRRAQWDKWTGGWEVERLASLHANILPADRVFDIGSEEGDFTVLFATWGAQVALFEPGQRIWPNVKASFDANHLPDPLAVWPGFCDETTDDAGATLLSSGAWNSWPKRARGPIITDHSFARPEERPDIPHVSLDDFVVSTGIVPDIITMDVEGAELRVMMGAAKTLHDHTPLVYISVHPNFLQSHYGQSDTDLYSFMAHIGYSRIHLATDHEQHELFWHPDGRVPVERAQDAP